MSPWMDKGLISLQSSEGNGFYLPPCTPGGAESEEINLGWMPNKNKQFEGWIWCSLVMTRKFRCSGKPGEFGLQHWLSNWRSTWNHLKNVCDVKDFVGFKGSCLRSPGLNPLRWMNSYCHSLSAPQAFVVCHTFLCFLKFSISCRRLQGPWKFCTRSQMRSTPVGQGLTQQLWSQDIWMCRMEMKSSLCGESCLSPPWSPTSPPCSLRGVSYWVHKRNTTQNPLAVAIDSISLSPLA